MSWTNGSKGLASSAAEMLSGWTGVVSREPDTSVLALYPPPRWHCPLERRRLGKMPRWGWYFQDVTQSPLYRKGLRRLRSPARMRAGREGKYGSHYPQCPRTGYYRCVHQRGRASPSRNPEAEPEEAGLVAAAVVAGQLLSPDCRRSPA